ncbi:hypothetical protein MIR68_002120 [Amoeboaphelidium protococcarum]|nr:hypothetical protein MIR68_002120 [Amoeboaphelidium protococcarum]
MDHGESSDDWSDPEVVVEQQQNVEYSNEDLFGEESSENEGEASEVQQQIESNAEQQQQQQESRSKDQDQQIADSDKQSAVKDQQEVYDSNDIFVQEENKDLFGEDEEDEDQDNLNSQDDQDQFDQEPKRIELKVDVPSAIPGLQSQQEHLATLKIPTFLNIEYSTYDPESYEAVGHKDFEVLHHLLTHTIRFNGDGKSNARLVKWSDGSWAFQIGKNVYPIKVQSSTAIYRRHENGGILESVNNVNEQWVILPTATRTHRIRNYEGFVENEQDNIENGQLSNANPGMKRTKFLSVFDDPNQSRKVYEQIEQEKQRAKRKAARQNMNSDEEEDDIFGASGAGDAEDDLDFAFKRARGTKTARLDREYGDVAASREEDDYAQKYGQISNKFLQNRGDDYDKEDDFVVDDDEELETYSDEADELDAFDDDDDEEGGGGDTDVEGGNESKNVGTPTGKAKRIITDDD